MHDFNKIASFQSFLGGGTPPLPLDPCTSIYLYTYITYKVRVKTYFLLQIQVHLPFFPSYFLFIPYQNGQSGCSLRPDLRMTAKDEPKQRPRRATQSLIFLQSYQNLPLSIHGPFINSILGRISLQLLLLLIT